MNYISSIILLAVLLTSCKNEHKSNQEKWVKTDSVFGDLELALEHSNTCKVLILRNQLPSGKKLNILKKIDKNIADLTELHTLKIYGIGQDSIPFEITKNKKLQVIEIRGFSLNDHELFLPSDLSALQNLKSLTLTGCGLTTIPTLPKQLEFVDLSNNNSSQLNKSVFGASLKELNVSKNKIKNLTNNQSCKNLKRLNLSNNQIEFIDFSSPIFSQLQRLVISNNPLQGFLNTGYQKIETIEALKIKHALISDLIGSETKHVWLNEPLVLFEKTKMKEDFADVKFIWFGRALTE